MVSCHFYLCYCFGFDVVVAVASVYVVFYVEILTIVLTDDGC